ncbi:MULTISPECIES: ATP F0F1 synthase subunit B [Kordiimonas]|uniref:F0F1 ATP synthase subunit B family protein n=1 Tax=Kordiimonas TaxID=288021 RepID=UPI001FF5F2F5|nr:MULTISPECIES: ATP F0F1 synthase subunit B [Kordiimonas]MCK0068787.1 ATP F0F1 synthase subunit B [Kordiimonas laminariae]UTW58138.1 ATP F0F1 synthase subunit B [Kordiimonas sp. SCSIO 12603]
MDFSDPTFWVAGSFLVFVGILLWKGVPKLLGEMLDARAEEIRSQIEEAKNLRDEAEQMLHDYQRKQRDAEKEAAEILARAEEDAKIMTEAAKGDIANMVERRTKAAEEKIAQAEASAVKEVQATAVDVAVNAATAVLADTLKGKAGKELANAAIEDVETKLH